jgi:D-alanyl-D-alanine carboxypeptidase
MRKLLGLSAAILSATLFATPTASAFDPASAATVFARMAASPALSNPSVSLIDVSTGKVVFESNANSPRKPASLMKLLSASATLRYLDPSKTFATSLALGPTLESVVIDGEYDPWISMNSKEAIKMRRTSFYALASKSLSVIAQRSGKPVKKLQVYYNDLYSKDVANFKAYFKKRGVSATIFSVSDLKAKSLATEQIIYSTSPPVKEIMNWFLTWSDNILAERMARLAARAAGNQFNGTLLTDTRSYTGKTDLQKLNVQIVNEWGIPVNLNGLDFSFTIAVEHE